MAIQSINQSVGLSDIDMWRSILQRVQSPRKGQNDPYDVSQTWIERDVKSGMTGPSAGSGNSRKAEVQDMATFATSKTPLAKSFLKSQEAEFDKMRVERDAARMVSISLANASVGLNDDKEKELLHQKANAIAWKCIANAALGANSSTP